MRRHYVLDLLALVLIVAVAVLGSGCGVTRQRHKMKRQDDPAVVRVTRAKILVSQNTGGPQGNRASGPVCDALLAQSRDREESVEIEPGLFVELDERSGGYLDRYHEFNGLVDNKSPQDGNLVFPIGQGFEYCAYYCGDNPPRDAEEARLECIWKSADGIYNSETKEIESVVLNLGAGDISWWIRNVHQHRDYILGFSWLEDGYRYTCVGLVEINPDAEDSLVRERFRVDWKWEIKTAVYIPDECTRKRFTVTG